MSNVAKVALTFQADPSEGLPAPQWIVTFHVMKAESSEPMGAGERTLIALDVRDWWLTSGGQLGDTDPARQLWSPGLLLKQISVLTIKPAEDGPTVVELDDDDAIGGSVHALQSPQTAWVVTLHSLLGTRRGRGRMFWPASHSAEGVAAAAYGVVFQDTRDEIGRQVAHLAWELVNTTPEDPRILAVFSRENDTPRAVVRFTVADRLATQRRRVPHVDVRDGYGLDGQRA